MKKETVKADSYTYESSDELWAKIFLSAGVNLILFIGVCFLSYEAGFSSGTKLMLLRASIAAAYAVAVVLHILIYKSNPLQKFRWVYILVTAAGMIPYIWQFVLIFIL